MTKKELRLLSSAHHLLLNAINGINDIDDPEDLEDLENTLRQSFRQMQELMGIQQDRAQRGIERLTNHIDGTLLELKGHPRNEPKFASFMAKLEIGGTK